MTDHETNLILVAVSIGESHAEGWRPIYQRVDQWAPITFRQKLNEVVGMGHVQRRQIKTGSGFYWVYWRHSTAPVQSERVPSTVLGAG